PAVVGTKTGTQQLKNGQLVTVDGEMGIVYEGAVGGVAKTSGAAPAVVGSAPRCPSPLRYTWVLELLPF
ncbi:MAG: hypothetical protein PHF80_04780, partial [Methanothrix sp.]|nr:hypothetical protein [Methanothrix sp.]